MPIRRILAALDFSEHSARALETAIYFAKQLDAELHLIHAFHLPVPLVTPYEVAVPDALIQEARDAASRKLADSLSKASAAGVKAHSHLAEVPAASAIVRVAEEEDVDLIVMGTHGHSGLKHLLLGSVAERTLRQAPCAVLTVKG